MKVLKRYEKNNSDISIISRSLSMDYDVHWHEYYEFELIVSGTGIYTINGVDYTVNRGDFVIIAPIDCHSVKNDKTNPLKIYNVTFPADASDKELLYELNIAKPNFLRLREKDFEEIYSMCRFMEASAEKKPLDRKYVKKMLDCMMINVITLSKKMNTVKRCEEKFSAVQLAVYYMQINFNNDITLKDVADYVGINMSYLSEMFSRDMGLSPKAYITNLRLDYAKKNLLFSDELVTSICYASGFNEFSSFSRAFKKRFGLSPRAFRAEYAKYTRR